MVPVRRLITLSLALMLPAQAAAVSVYLNGTKVDGLSNTAIDKCGVQFDPKGDVRLSCPGYSVRVEGAGAGESQGAAAAPPAVPGKVSKKYFLVTEQAAQGATEFDIELYVNSKFVRRLKNEEEQIVTEITKHFVGGPNTVTFIAKKRPSAQRKSFSPEHFFRVIIGEGNASGDRVMIDNPVITFQKTAADEQDATQEFSLQAQ